MKWLMILIVLLPLEANSQVACEACGRDICCCNYLDSSHEKAINYPHLVAFIKKMQRSGKTGFVIHLFNVCDNEGLAIEADDFLNNGWQRFHNHYIRHLKNIVKFND